MAWKHTRITERHRTICNRLRNNEFFGGRELAVPPAAGEERGEPALSLGEGGSSRKGNDRSSTARMPGTRVRTVGSSRQTRDCALHVGIEDSVAENQQESFQAYSGNLTAPASQKSLLNGANRFQFGRLSFFKNAAYRGSLCKLCSRGSTFVPIRPLSRWA